MIPNVARFKINNTASEDAEGDRGFDTTANTTLTLTLEKNPAVDAITVTYDLPDPNNALSPQASLFYSDNVFVQNGARQITLTNPNASVSLVVSPSSDISSFPIRCTVVTARGTQVFERIVCIRKSGLRMTVPSERQEYSGRGWSDALNELTKAMADGGVSTPLASVSEIGVISAFSAGVPRILTSDGVTAGGVWATPASVLALVVGTGGANTVYWSNGTANSFTGSPVISTSLSIGTVPSDTGGLRLTYGLANGIYARNQANGSNVALLSLDSTGGTHNVVRVGPSANFIAIGALTTATVYFGGDSTGYNTAFVADGVYFVGGGFSILNGVASLTAYTAGVNSASGGLLRALNNTVVAAARNAANNADLVLLQTDNSNNVIVGNATVPAVYFDASGALYFRVGGSSSMTVGSGTTSVTALTDIAGSQAATGWIRGRNNVALINARNQANTQDVRVLSTDTSDRVKLGGAFAVQVVTENDSGAVTSLAPFGGHSSYRRHEKITRTSVDPGTGVLLDLTDIATLIGRTMVNNDAGYAKIEIVGAKTAGTITPHYWESVVSWSWISNVFKFGDITKVAESFPAADGLLISGVTVAQVGNTSVQFAISCVSSFTKIFLVKVTFMVYSAV